MTKIIRMERKNEGKDKKKRLKALIYVIIGFTIFTVAALFAIYVWFSGTFMANMWWARKAIYILIFAVGLAGIWLANEGLRYLSKKKRR